MTDREERFKLINSGLPRYVQNRYRKMNEQGALINDRIDKLSEEGQQQ